MCHESCEGEGRQIFAQIILLRAEGRRRRGVRARGGDAEFKTILILKKKGAFFIV